MRLIKLILFQKRSNFHKNHKVFVFLFFSSFLKCFFQVVKFHDKKKTLFLNLFIFYYDKISQILHSTYHKLNGMHNLFIMTFYFIYFLR
jgi:hypothetical protein